MKGLFIAIEGIDGSGKGYVMMRLQEYLMGSSKKYDHILLTREPTNSTIGQQIREILANETDPMVGARKCTELYISDRKQHVENDILPALKKGYVVLCDRYKYSTMAFQAAQGISLKELIDSQKGFPTPDVVFLLDLPVKQAVARISTRKGNNEKFEKVEFSEKVRQNYLEIAKSEKAFIVIDASKEKEIVFQQIKKELEKRDVLPY